MTSDTAHHDFDTGEVARPGHDLRAARERDGESIESMAERLRLSVSQLEALERDDYAELPPPAFVRGYVRAYARELGLEPERFVAAYDATGISGNDPELRVATRSEDQAGGHSALVGLLLIALVALGGLGAWWYQQQITGPGASEAPSEAETGAENAGGSAANEDAGGTTSGEDPAADDSGAAAGEAGSEAEASETAAEDSTTGDSSDTLAADTGSDDGATGEPDAAVAASSTTEAAAGDAGAENAESTGEGGQGGATETATTAASGEDTVAEAASDDGAAPEAADAEPASADAAASEEPGANTPAATDSPSRATTAAASTGPDQVVLEFDGRSWLEVSDSRDRDLVYTLYFGSEPLTLRGYAPFEIFLGNSPAVDVTFNGEPVDKSAFTRSDNTARFVVDQDGARSR